MAVDSIISGGCIISGATVRRSLLFTNVRVNSFARVTDSVILPDVNIGRHSRIIKAIIEKGCHVPESMVIGEDLEADRERFYVSPQGVRLVAPEALGQKIHFVR